MDVDAPNDDPTYLNLPAHRLRAEYWIASPGDDAHEAGDVVAIDDVPALVFSEVMRHCDLFVSVASIATDATWLDRGADAAHPSDWDRDAEIY